jgi:outer membrane receptor for monomeric catechols
LIHGGALSGIVGSAKLPPDCGHTRTGLEAARECIQNPDYAVFSLNKTHRAANQADCLACHKPLDKVSYTFTLKELTTLARK